MPHFNWKAATTPTKKIDREHEHAHTPQYDQLLAELRRAQELRGQEKQPVAREITSNPVLDLNGIIKAQVKRRGWKKVRFLEDGDGNPHTSIIVDTSLSCSSSEEDNALNTTPPTHDHDHEVPPPPLKPPLDTKDLQIPNVVWQVLQELPKTQKNVNTTPNSPPKPALPPKPRPSTLNIPTQSVIHLEPDDPNSLSDDELPEPSRPKDAEETKTPKVDPFDELANLLEQSLQEIQRLEQESSAMLPPSPTVPPPTPSSAAKREPLYELIGRKRTTAPVSAPHVAPEPFEEIWLKREEPQQRNPIRQATPNGWAEDNQIYSRLWEASSSASCNNSSHNQSPKLPPTSTTKTGDGNHAHTIQSLARKARLEHWKLAGFHHNNQSAPPTYLSQLPLVNLPDPHTSGSLAATKPTSLGIELQWPPPPVPSSPSSASLSPTTPTKDCCAKLEDSSPKCFGHRTTFQWPVPPTTVANPLQRNSSFNDTDKGELNGSRLRRTGSLREKPRPPKPASLEAAQDWYWTEEFPKGSGLEPGTGSMATWFHGAISRNEAEAMLMNQPPGTFLARLTERLWGYALSVRGQRGVSHFLVESEPNPRPRYVLLGAQDPPHKTLVSLVEFYSKRSLTPEGGEKLIRACPQESTVRIKY